MNGTHHKRECFSSVIESSSTFYCAYKEGTSCVFGQYFMFYTDVHNSQDTKNSFFGIAILVLLFNDMTQTTTLAQTQIGLLNKHFLFSL